MSQENARSPRPALLVVWLAAMIPCVAAQGTIQDGNVQYTIHALPSADGDTVDCDFTADPLFAPDVLREQGWWYRFDDEHEETPFHDDGTVVQSYVGPRADLAWDDLGGRDRLRARMGIEVLSTGGASGVVQSRLTLTNRTSEPIGITIFHYVDVDACRAESDVTFGNGADQTIVGECALQQVRVRATQLDRWEVQPSSESECGLLDPGRLRLANAGLPLVRGDHSACFCWKRTVPPDLPIVLVVRLDHTSGPCGAARSIAYGQGAPGVLGVPEIATSVLPRIGEMAELELTRGRPGSFVVWLFGFDRAHTVVDNLTFLIQPGPRGLQFDFLAGVTDPQGRSTLQVPVPASLSFCAELIYWQGFVIDDSVQGTFPFSYTAGEQWVLGR